MKALVVYDSNFGNTKMIAEEIGKALNAKTIFVSNFWTTQLKDVDLLVVGSPINAWKPSEKMLSFLTSLKKDDLKGIKATAFDTRVTLFIHGDAASKISGYLEKAGAEIISPPHAFIVKGREGPLTDGELLKAKQWGDDLLKYEPKDN